MNSYPLIRRFTLLLDVTSCKFAHVQHEFTSTRSDSDSEKSEDSPVEGSVGGDFGDGQDRGDPMMEDSHSRVSALSQDSAWSQSAGAKCSTIRDPVRQHRKRARRF